MMTMHGIEVLARMENLGLSRSELARLTNWQQSRVSEVVTARRRTPPHVAAKLEELAEVADQISEWLLEAGQAQNEATPGGSVIVPSYTSDAAFWADWPEFDGVPASVHRAAALEAVRSLKEEGLPARLVDAGAAGSEPASDEGSTPQEPVGESV